MSQTAGLYSGSFAFLEKNHTVFFLNQQTEGCLFFLVRLEYLQICGAVLCRLPIECIDLRIQAGMAEAPAGEGVWLLEALEVHATLGQNRLNLGGILNLVRLGPWLQI